MTVQTQTWHCAMAALTTVSYLARGSPPGPALLQAPQLPLQLPVAGGQLEVAGDEPLVSALQGPHRLLGLGQLPPL